METKLLKLEQVIVCAFLPLNEGEKLLTRLPAASLNLKMDNIEADCCYMEIQLSAAAHLFQPTALRAFRKSMPGKVWLYIISKGRLVFVSLPKDAVRDMLLKTFEQQLHLVQFFLDSDEHVRSIVLSAETN